MIKSDSTERIKADIARNDRWLERARRSYKRTLHRGLIGEAITNVERLQAELRAELAAR